MDKSATAFLVSIVLVTLLIVAAILGINYASVQRAEDVRSQFDNFDIGINSDATREMAEEIQSEIDRFVNSHYLDEDGNIRSKTPEPKQTDDLILSGMEQAFDDAIADGIITESEYRILSIWLDLLDADTRMRMQQKVDAYAD